MVLQPGDHQRLEVVASVFEDSLLPRFRRAVRNARSFTYDRTCEPAYFTLRLDAETEPTAEEVAQQESNEELRQLLNNILPTLAYAYSTPGGEAACCAAPGTGAPANPYYRNPDVLQLYIRALEHSYHRGLTEQAWLPDAAGRASADALKAGFVRPAGDFSTLSLRFGGFIQSVFLMRDSLAAAQLLPKYRAVVRNLVVNNGAMYGAFFAVAREEAGIDHAKPMPLEEQYYLNADGVRLFVDYFWPYFLLIEDRDEQSRMGAILARVIERNIAPTPGVQGTIKPDGTGFHHATAYVGAYTPFALEAFAQLLYLAKGTTYYRPENVEAVKLALEAYRVMVQKYSVSPALRGRLIRGSGEGATTAISKAIAFLAHPDGPSDFEMQARFGEFFDDSFFWGEERRDSYYEGNRGVGIRGLGIFRLVADVKGLGVAPAEAPSGVWIKPYAAAAFFRRGDWLVTAKGFSQYFWDYEGPLNKRENSFGQNWAYGLLQVFSAGTPVSETGSGYDRSQGWDWYHVPGTTASHYPIERRTDRGVRRLRTEGGIVQRDTHRNYNTKTFVGGVSLGAHGFFVQDLEGLPFTAATDLRGRKSFFFVGDRVLALGTQIAGGTQEHETHTTIFQTRLETRDTLTWVNGMPVGALDGARRLPAGASATMVDSVGNSYFLASSTADLVLSRSLQQSMTETYEPTEAPYAQAYLNHGIKPQGDSYLYVLIPADPEGQKLEALAADPEAHYQVVDASRMHLVRFPQERITAYAFYDPVTTPDDFLVRRVSLPAAVITQEEGPGIRLAASVPDIGWDFDDQIIIRGLAYTSKHFARQQARRHTLRVYLRGRWRVGAASNTTRARHLGEGTIVQMHCSDGLSARILLSPYE